MGISSKSPNGEGWSCKDCTKKSYKKKKVGFLVHRTADRAHRTPTVEDEADIKVTAVVKPKRNHILEKSSPDSHVVESSGEEARPRKTSKRKLSEETGERSNKISRVEKPKIREQEVSSDEFYPESDCVHSPSGDKSSRPERKRRKKKKGKRYIRPPSDEPAADLKGEVEQRRERTRSKPKGKCRLEEIESGSESCKLCGYGYDLPDELELGPLFRFGVCQAHLHCLMFSSGLIQVSRQGTFRRLNTLNKYMKINICKYAYIY